MGAKMTKRFPLALAAVVAAAGLVQIVGVPNVAAIENGDTISTAPPWAAFVTTIIGAGPYHLRESTCTGTIVSTAWVLTAAHCVVEHDANGNPTSTPLPKTKLRVVLGRDNQSKATSTGAEWTVDEIQIYRDYTGGTSAWDAALLKLHGALPETALPLPLAPSGFGMPDGAPADLYGYGNTLEAYPKSELDNKDPVSYSSTKKDYLRKTKPGSYIQDSDCTSDVQFCFERVGASGSLHGDSGGPWVAGGNAPYIVGVNSLVDLWVRTSETTIKWTHSLAARLSNRFINDWVHSTADVLNPRGGTIYRDPTTRESWLAEGDGFNHPIPDGGTFECLVHENRRVVNLPTFFLRELAVASPNATCSGGGPGGDPGGDPGKQATTVGISADPNPVVFGQSARLSSTVTGASSTPTGNVSFVLDGLSISSPQLVGGRASVNV
ncbi:MAG: hypothetical protein QOI61_858, partial [Actinomycetota bacterium]